jgi:hypothetical protein
MSRQFFVRLSLFAGVLFLFLASSCRGPKELAVGEVKPMGTNKLLKRIEQNAFDYDYLTIRKINCQFSSSQSKSSFRIRLKAQKDKKILVSISKINIPVGRVLLTPDSVVYVNYIDHNYFYDDYSFISDFLNMDVDFKTVQSIISNNAFSYRNDPRDDYKTFDSYVENGQYVLQSEKNRKIYKLEDGNPQKIERRLRRLDDQALILQKMFFEPQNFSLTRLNIQDKTNNRNIFMNFNDFTKVEGNDYPGEIDMEFLSSKEQIKMKIRMSGFSTEKINSFSIKIPEKYEEIQVK